MEMGTGFVQWTSSGRSPTFPNRFSHLFPFGFVYYPLLDEVRPLPFSVFR